MFTGIVEELGRVAAIEPQPDAIRLTIEGSLAVSDANRGDSICVNGVCLTAIELEGDTFTADVMRETLNRTALGALNVGDPVNLERAMNASTRFGGHVVQGHVDGVGTVVNRVHSENWDVVTIEIPSDLMKYIVDKGSITVDGTSLTVSNKLAHGIEVSLIPTTLEHTTLGIRTVGQHVNLEVDVLAKYVETLLAGKSS